jgi:HEAT repeat protein
MPDRPLFYKIFQPLEKIVTVEDEEFLLKNLSSKNKDRILLALKGLAVLGTPKAFEEVKKIIEFTKEPHSKVRAHAFTAISKMPPSLTLEMAREWFQKKEWYFQVAGGEILANHATTDDIPLLIQALKDPQIISCDDFRLGNTLEALARFEGIGHIPEIEYIFLIVPHSYHRCRAAHAMASTALDVFQTKYAYECLWDCHWYTRIGGCYNVALSHPGALARLIEIVEDQNESDNVRKAAQEVINEF